MMHHRSLKLKQSLRDDSLVIGLVIENRSDILQKVVVHYWFRVSESLFSRVR